MASISKKSSGVSLKVDMALICAEPGIAPIIPTKRVMEAMWGPYSTWMMQEGPIDFSVRWGASL